MSFKRLSVKSIFAPENWFVLANNAYAEGMSPKAAFHLVITACQSICLLVSIFKGENSSE